MLSRDKVLIILVAVVFTVENVLILKTRRRPEFGYRVLLSTVFLINAGCEFERAFGEGLSEPIPRAVLLVISANFPISEGVMLLRRRADDRKRRVYIENALVEDPYCEA